MARPTNAQRLTDIHQEALAEFDSIQSAVRDERLQCVQDRRFYSIAGAMWEGPLGMQFENKPRLEVNKIGLAVQRIFNEYRNNRVSVQFVSKTGEESDSLADTCARLFRADEQDSGAEEAYDNAFEEAVGGGFGAFRLRTVYENEGDDEDERQRIRWEPIFDADTSVFFDLGAKRQDKSDAKRCWVLSSMTIDAYRETYDDDPTTWPKDIEQTEFDWCTPDVVYVAEHYRVEEKPETVHVYRALDGTEERYRDDDLTEEMLSELAAIGSVKVREKRVKRRRVRKYIMSGGKVLEDLGYIAGQHIPIVPVYGRRWFVDNIERCSGHVRMAKDPQRLKNMQLSKLAEISALSSIEKPIFTPEQVAGHQVMWQEDNIKNYPYLLVNTITGPDGMSQAAGPVGYTKSSDVPPAMAALLSLAEQDIRDVLGNQEQGDKIVANVSGKALETVQQRLDMQSYIYISNFGNAKRRGGEIWLSIAKEIYVEPGRKMKALGVQGEIGGVELLKPAVDDKGALKYENDLSTADLDLAIEIGPSFRSQRAAIVQSLINLIAITQDPQTQSVLQSMVIMNMEGEGLGETREYFRKKLVEMGVLEPREKDQQWLQAAQEAAQNDPNAALINAMAQESQAKADKMTAEVELTQAKTVETLAKVGQEGSMPASGGTGGEMQPGQPVNEKERLQLEAMEIENEIKRRKLEREDEELNKIRSETRSKDTQTVAAEEFLSATAEFRQLAQDLTARVNEVDQAVQDLAKTMRSNADRAIEAISRPKRIIRERGRITRIEVQ